MMDTLVEISKLGGREVVGRAIELRRQGICLDHIKAIQVHVPSLDVGVVPRHIDGTIDQQVGRAIQLRDQTGRTAVFVFSGNIVIVGPEVSADQVLRAWHQQRT